MELFGTLLEPSEAVIMIIGDSESFWPLACAPWKVGSAIWGLKPVISTNADAKNENVIAFFTLVEAFFWFDENLLRLVLKNIHLMTLVSLIDRGHSIQPSGSRISWFQKPTLSPFDP